MRRHSRTSSLGVAALVVLVWLGLPACVENRVADTPDSSTGVSRQPLFYGIGTYQIVSDYGLCLRSPGTLGQRATTGTCAGSGARWDLIPIYPNDAGGFSKTVHQLRNAGYCLHNASPAVTLESCSLNASDVWRPVLVGTDTYKVEGYGPPDLTLRGCFGSAPFGGNIWSNASCTPPLLRSALWRFNPI